MEGPAAENIILEAGKSGELISVFRLVEETQANGEIKFSPTICRDLAKAVSCRTYAGAVLELCHLVHVADARGGSGGYIHFFWGHGPARPAGFKGAIRNSLKNPTWRGTEVTVTDSGVDIAYSDGGFSITYSRMPFLSALMEFLISSIGFGDLNDVFAGMLGPGISKDAVSRCANELSRCVYDYLKDHLPTAQNMRKFHCLIGFMKERHGVDFTPSAIDDETILDFWISKTADGPAAEGDFKTYESVFRAFLRLRHALEQAAGLYALDGARSIGANREAGEVDPDSIHAMVETVDEYRSPLLVLQEPPAGAIKFLNNKEMAGLELLMDCGKAAFDLALSLMRCEVFTKKQGRVTQALRRRADAGELRGIIDECALVTYEDRREEYARKSFHMDNMLLASLYALVRARNEEAISLIVALRPDLDLRPLANLLRIGKETADNVVMLSSKSVSDRFMDMIGDADKAGKDMVALVADAREAFNGVPRRGFSAERLDESAVVDGFAVGGMVLLGVKEHLADFLRKLENARLPYENWTRQFDADKDVFTKQFHILYEGS